MQRTAWVSCACLMGGLMVFAVWAGLDAPAGVAQLAPLSAESGDVVINEVAWGGTAASSADEWIELYNTSPATLSLEGWHLVDDDSLDLALSGAIPSGGYYLIERTDDDAVQDVSADLWGSFGSGGLRNDGEMLTLTDDLGQVIDVVNPGGGGWAAGSGSPGYYAMERIDPLSGGDDANWCANDGFTRNGLDANGDPINGTPRQQNSCYTGPLGRLADLAVAKTGTERAHVGGVVTYTISLSNTGAITASGARLTDTLPTGLDFVTQTSSFTFTPSQRDLIWELGGVSTGTDCLITVTARMSDTAIGALVNRVTATAALSEAFRAENTAAWTTTVEGGQVLIGGVLYDGCQSDDPDEAVQLVNVGTASEDLSGWELCKDAGSGLSCRTLPAALISPTTRLWVARQALSFTLSFGFTPHREMSSWLPYGLSNSGDEVVLRDEHGAVVDALVYGTGLTTTVGWSGPAVEAYKVGNRALEGQILYRIPDEATGLPRDDTDTAADWLQSTEDLTRGRRVVYPGWDLASLFWPLSATEPASIAVGITPDNGFDVVSQTIVRAQRSISVEVYSLRHPEIITTLVQRARAGVDVTVLLEGRQVGMSFSDPRWQQELWACREIESAGGACWFMIHEPDEGVVNRYDYVHAKLLIVDGEWALIGSQNLSVSSLPSDPRSNGTHGSRGVVLATDADSVVSHASRVFDLDLDPDHHQDLLRWDPNLTGTYGAPLITYTPQLTVPDGVSYTVRFSDPLVVSGTFGFETFTAPEAALRQSDGLLGLLARAGAGDSVYAEQLYEHVDWGGGPNLRLEAYIAAARRGARVRLLLNGGTFGRSFYENDNASAVAYVNQIARAEGLDLEAALGDPTSYGIHNKMVLVWLDGEGGYVHVGSINGSESSNKVNREIAVQIQAEPVYDYLRAVFELDWRWSQPICLPLVLRGYVAPANHPILSEVNYQGSCEWVEIFNPSGMTVTLTGWGIGDAQRAGKYEGMYQFPSLDLGPDVAVIVAGDAGECGGLAPDYEMFGSHSGVPNLDRHPGWGTGEFGLGNGGDEVLLLDPADRPVDVVVYGSGSYAGVEPHAGVEWGDSLERVPADVDTDDCGKDFRAGWSPGWTRR